MEFKLVAICQHKLLDQFKPKSDDAWVLLNSVCIDAMSPLHCRIYTNHCFYAILYLVQSITVVKFSFEITPMKNKDVWSKR